MELNRNHYFAVGTIVLLLGIQLRFVESFILNEASSQFIAEKLDKKKKQQQAAEPNPFATLLSVPVATPKQRTVQPPPWLGWSLISVGAVLVLYSLAMKRPG